MDNGTIGLVGLILSLILGAIQIYQFVRGSRLDLSAISNLTSDPEIGNDILVQNASGTPASVYYLDLAWVKPTGRFWRPHWLRKIESSDSPLLDSYCNIPIPPHGQKSFHFSHGDYFTWGSGLKYDIYLRLWLVGARREKWFYVTGPAKR
jgi:hypothetical protein